MSKVTFDVDRTVSNPTGPLTVISPKKLWADLHETKVEGFGMNTTLPLVRSHTNPFVDAVYQSYGQHYPLVLSPDDVWVVIAQGFATHINENAEALRNRFVSHQGKKLLHLDLPNFVKGSDSNPWDTVLGRFSKLIADNIGPEQRNLIVSSFTTTGPIEQAASEVVLMGAMKDYFEYGCTTCCGIPKVTLLGTLTDWESIRARAEELGTYGLEWWTKELLPVLDQFVRAYKGDVDKAFWQTMFKPAGGSGGPYICGWVNVFFPYLRNRYDKTNYRNEFLDWNQYKDRWMGAGPTTDKYPLGLTRVPFWWDYLGTRYEMEFLGGFTSIRQDPQDLSVQPVISWAVRESK